MSLEDKIKKAVESDKIKTVRAKSEIRVRPVDPEKLKIEASEDILEDEQSIIEENIIGDIDND